MSWLRRAMWLLACVAQAQPICWLSGSIKDHAQAGVGGAEVRVSASGAASAAIAKTDPKGFFCFPDLVPGTYTLTITAAGFQTQSRTIRAGAARSLVIHLKALGPAAGPVSEMRVAPSAYVAENGRAASSVLSLMAPGGANRFHASTEWSQRHESYAANDFFNNRNGIGRPRSRGNIFYHALSGPLCVPGRLPCNRTKVLFSVRLETQSDVASYGSRAVRVPTELERAGDFSQSFDVSGRLIPIYDPANGQRPFAGQVIPASRFQAAGANILKLFPLPNFTDPAPSRVYQWNYISSLTRSAPRRTEIARADYAARKNLRIYGRFNHTREDQLWSNGLPGGMNFPLTPIVFGRPVTGTAIHMIATFSPQTSNALYAGVSQDQRRYLPESLDRLGRQATGIDLPSRNSAWNPDGILPNMTFAGVANYANPSLGNSIPYFNSNRVYSLVDNLSKVSGAHTYKFGVAADHARRYEDASLIGRGAISFDRDRGNPFDTNYPYANALIGSYLSYTEPIAIPRGVLPFTNVELYAQDTWRARPNLLIDYGVRLQHNPPQYDLRMQLAAFGPALFQGAALIQPALVAGKRVALDPTTGATYPEAMIGMLAPGSGGFEAGQAGGGLPALSLGPRFGVAWDPFRRGRTVLRAGGGAFFDRVSFQALTNASGVNSTMVYYGTLANLGDTRTALSSPANLMSLPGHNRAPSIYNFSAGIQQQVGQAVIGVTYVGSLARHLLWQRNMNPVPVGANFIDLHPENRDPSAPSRPLPRNFLRPYLGFGDIQLLEFASTSNYNSLQASVNRRMARGVQVTALYIFSKTLGSAAGEGAAVSPFLAPRERNYGPLPWDMRHVLSLQYTWTLPKPGKYLVWRGFALLTDGWEISSVNRFSSGPPFTPGFSTVDGQDVTGTPSEYARPAVVDPGTPPAQRFTRAPRGSLGDAGVGVLRARGINNWDTSASRRLRLSEGLALQFRVESYNTWNHTQFSMLLPWARFDRQGAQVDPMFLQPIAARSPRRVQLSLRLGW